MSDRESNPRGREAAASRRRLAICLFILASLAPSVAPALEIRAPELTAEERAWLDRHDRIRVGPAPNFPPIEFFDESGNFSGIAAEYAAVLEERLGIEFEIQKLASWNDVVEATRRGEIDVWLEAAENEERREYMLFTEPYLYVPSLIIVREDHPGELSVEDLAGMQVVATEGYAVVDYLRETVPGIELITVPNIETGLQRVSFGSADAVVASSAAASFYIERLGLPNLKVAGESGWTWELSIGSRSDWPLLHDILTKTLATIGPDQRREIFRRWVFFDSTSDDFLGIPRWIVGFAVLALLLLVVLLVLRRSGPGEDIRAGVLSTWPVYLAGMTVIAAILTAGWLADRRIKVRMQDDIGNALQTVLRTTGEALHQFFREREEEALVWAGHEDVWMNCRALVSSPSPRSPAHSSLETQLESLLENRGYLGFMMLGPDGTVLASNQARIVGEPVASTSARELLQRVLASPRRAGVGLPRRETGLTGDADDERVMMMLAAAAPETDAGIPCVLTLLMDPQQDFSEILQRGRIGMSGESYAFNREGQLISASRFEEDLRRIGMIGEGQTGILNVEIRDPGVNLVQGQRPDRPLADQPMTTMAQSATSGHTDMNLDGYQDYRGVPVIGAWTWDEATGLGITTEIDVDEAYASLFWIHRVFRGVTFLIVALVVALMAAFTLHNIRRRRIEAQLAESEERGRLILGSAGEGIFGVGKDGLVNFINTAGLRMLGFSSEEILGQRIHALVHHSRPDGSPYPVEECPMYHAFTRGDAATRDNEVLWRKDGGCFPVEYTSKPILKDDEIVGSVVIFRDITERKEAQEQLNRQSAALEAAVDGITITATDGTIRWVNRAFSELTGYSFDETVGGNPRVLKSGFHTSEFYQGMWATISAGKVWNGEVINRRKDGSTYTEEMSITPVRNDEGVIVNFVAIKRDITERKKMEAELERARKRMEDELNVGREIQMSMLPLTFPAFPEHDEFDVFATLQAAREVGGDFYDFFFIDENRFCVCVGDVSGKGVPAALFMAVTKTLLKSNASMSASTAGIISHVNTEVSRENTESMFVTVFIGILDIRTGEFVYTNAGHNPPYVKRRDGSIERLGERHGPVIGAMEDLEYGEDRLTLEPDDLLLLYTDGVTEAMNDRAELFGEPRLVETLQLPDVDSAELHVQACVDAVKSFEGAAEQADDITILALWFRDAVRSTDASQTIKLAGEPEQIAPSIERFDAFAQRHQLPDPVTRKVKIALDDVLQNVVSYGYPDARGRDIVVSLALNNRRLKVCVSDNGIAFNPLEQAAPKTDQPLEQRELGGLGLHIVRNLADDVAYRREDEKNYLTLVFELPSDPPLGSGS